MNPVCWNQNQVPPPDHTEAGEGDARPVQPPNPARPTRSFSFLETEICQNLMEFLGWGLFTWHLPAPSSPLESGLKFCPLLTELSSIIHDGQLSTHH